VSDHSKPRRWTLAIPAASRARELIPRVLQLTSVLFSDEERVPVREDCITEADVEAIAKRLSDAAYCDIAPAAYYDEARSLLSVVFEGGEQS
jgi:hypothetical protein